MTHQRMNQDIKATNTGQPLDGTVSTALLDRLSARIARREGRMKYRASDRWARHEAETTLPPAA